MTRQRWRTSHDAVASTMVAPLHEPMVMEDGDATRTGVSDGSDVPAPLARGSRTVVAPLQYRDADRYEVLAEHGRGGIGRVQRAHDRELGRSVAIKELIRRGDIGEVRFLREAMITARLEHPGIVPIHEAGRWPDGTPFYVMKLVAGRSLKELIDERKTVDERIGLLHHVIAIADAVAYAHERDIIHRDLKPANVIAGDFGETVVIDWGLAKDLRADDDAAPAGGPYRGGEHSDLTVAGSVLGTPLYMSPEQARGERVDQRADVFAIGAMLWELCSKQRKPPADVHERARLLRQSRIDRDLAAIIMKALAPDPGERYRNAGELAADLKAFKSGARIAARQYSLFAMLARWIHRHRVLAASLAVITTLALAGSVVYVHNIANERDRADAAAAHAEAQSAIAAAERDYARLAEASALLDKDPTRARQVLDTLAIRTPQYALLRSRANHGAANRIVAVQDGIARLLRNPVTSDVAVVTHLGELTSIDLDTGQLHVVDRDLQEAVTHGASGWVYARKPFVAKTTKVATTGSQPIDVGELLVGTEGTLVVAGNRTYAIDRDNLYTIEHSGAVLVRRGVRAVAGSDRVVMVCTSSGDLEVTIDGVREPQVRCASNPSAWPFAAAGTDYAALLDANTLLLVRGGKRLRIPTHVTGEYELALASSGLLAVADMDGKPSFVRADSDRLEPAPPHTARVLGVAVDGDIAAWGFDDGAVIALDTKTGQSWKFIGHGGPVGLLTVDARRARLVSASREEVRVWSLTPSATDVVDRLPCLAYNAVRSADDTRIALDCNDGVVREWTRATGAMRILHKHDEIAQGIAWSGDAVCSAGWEGRVLCTAGGVTRELRPRGTRIRRLVASPVGEQLVVSTDDGVVSAAGGAELYRHSAVPFTIAFSPDGRRLASGGSDGSVIVYDVVARRVRSTTVAHAGLVVTVAWRDGELWTAGMDGKVVRWRDDTGTLTLLDSVGKQGAVRFLQLMSTGWTATIGGRTLVVHRGSRELRLDLDRHVERSELSPDHRYVVAATSSELVIVDLVRRAVAMLPLPSRGGYVGFANPGFVTVSNATGVVTTQLSSLEYIAYELPTDHQMHRSGQ